jgi:hypothetical protein
VSVHLNVVRFEQKPGLCGAATAQMILHYKGLIGNTVADQNTLWGKIKVNTVGPRPTSKKAKFTAHDCPKFTQQKCDKCQGATKHQCWCTFPPALLATLQHYNLPFAMLIAPDDKAATASVMASIGFDIPAAALVQAGLHWIAVAGYETGGAGAQMIGGQSVSAIYIRDPEVGAANHDVGIDTWLDEFVSPVLQCGGFFSKLVVISATAPAAVAQTVTPATPSTPTVMKVRKPKKQRRKR